MSKLTPGKPKEPIAEPKSPPKVEEETAPATTAPATTTTAMTTTATTTTKGTQSLAEAPTTSAKASTIGSIDHKPAASKAVSQRENATFVTLARNSDLWDLAKSIREVEDRFNRNYKYDWVFLNEQPFDEEFKEIHVLLRTKPIQVSNFKI